MLYRIEPAMGPEAYKTYAIRAPRSTHQRKASCREVECAGYRYGWVTRIDENTDLGKRQAAYIRALSGRRFQESLEGGLVEFQFYPGQTCFREHFVSLDREPQYLAVGGDWRGNPRGERQEFKSFDSWVNDFGDHQYKLWRAQQ